MAHTPANDLWFVPQLIFGLTHLGSQMAQIPAAGILQFDALEIVLDEHLTFTGEDTPMANLLLDRLERQAKHMAVAEYETERYEKSTLYWEERTIKAE